MDIAINPNASFPADREPGHAIRRSAALGRFGGLLVAFFGILALTGWALDIQFLKSILPAAATVKPNTAICFILLGCSIALSDSKATRSNRRQAILLASVAIALSALTLAQDCFGFQAGIDQLLFRDSQVLTNTGRPGRMSPATASAFLLIGLGVLGLDARSRIVSAISQCLTMVGLSIGLLACTGYLYGAESLYRIPPFSSVALLTAISILILGISLFAVRPTRGFMRTVTGDNAGSQMARRVIPLAISVPFLLGWIRLAGQRQGLYGTEFGLSLLTTTVALTFGGLVTLHAYQLARTDEERQADRGKLRESEHRLRLLIDGVSDYAIFMLDLEGRIVTWNHGAERLKGYSEAEIVGKSFHCFYSAEDIQAGIPAKSLARAASMGKSADEGWRLRKDGSRFWASVEITGIRDEEGVLIGYAKVTRDLSERVRAEQALLDNQMRLSELVESAMDAIISVDEKLHIVLFNAAAEKMFGYLSEDILGKSLQILVPERYREGHDQLVHGFRKTGVSSRRMGSLGHVSGVRANGDEFPLEASISQVKVRGETFLTVILRDITDSELAKRALIDAKENLERKVIERTRELEIACSRAEQADLHKSQFLASMSHELRTPLNAIIGFSELLYDGKLAPLQPRQQEYLGDVLTSARHLLQLINDILDLSKVEAGKLTFEPEFFSVEKAIHEVCAVAKALALSRQVELESCVAPDLDIVKLDQRQFKQVLFNLISNAIKFSHSGGQVIVRAQPVNGDSFRLTVEDSGIGVAEHEVDKLFLEFEQLQSSGERRQAGSGLGLAITKKVVELQGGKIDVKSELGVGTVFEVRLPRESAA